MNDYHVSDRRKIIGDLDNTPAINVMPFNTKEQQYSSQNLEVDHHISIRKMEMLNRILIMHI